ncbi:MAG: Lytic transglycosylase, catalytic [Rhodocyclaceae bacterium]|nr:Lytic transglycosylase, catalytic [Rhodocyclaceae bacterium]
MKSRVFVLSFFLISPLFAQDGRDTAFLIARDAFRVGDYLKLERAAATVGSDHDLSPYVEYFRLRMNLEQADAMTVRDFLDRYDGSYVAEKLRGDWLRLLARKSQWEGFEAEYPKLVAPEQEVLCLDLQARLARNDKTALDEAQPLWLSLLEPPDGCQPVLEALIWEKRVLADDVWTRIRRQFEANRINWAKATMHYLPASQSPDNRQVDAVADRAMATLVKLPSSWAATRPGRETAALAVQRVATNDPRAAADQLEKLQDRMGNSERLWAWSEIALNAAKRHMPDALAWYAQAGAAPLSDEGHQWKVRAALRAQEWGVVRSAIEAMPAQLAARPEWIYWLGRAYKAGGRTTQANALFQRIAGQAHFYGNLADEELDQAIAPPAKAAPISKEELAAATANPGLKRALAFFRLELRTEGVKEWNWSLRAMSDRELLAAAELAKRNEIYDRAIAAADRTKNEHDFSLRYLAPFGDQVRSVARDQSVDDAWVYGLMRQESRFITHAKSGVGASGLMQLMPATARWVAKKLGLKDFHQGKVNDTDTNLLLGTAYMRMVMENLDNQPVLASAAYNAGPGRARKWRAEQPLEGAIYAETIPFSETRDYVKKVMSNSVYYSSLFTGKPDSLKARLGVIGGRVADSPKDADLP